MRGVGHQVLKQDRDSKYLCRLQVYVREPKETTDEPGKEGQEDEGQQDLKSASNTKAESTFVIVKFDEPGTIVWAPPEDTNEFNRSGDLLFIVELADEES